MKIDQTTKNLSTLKFCGALALLFVGTSSAFAQSEPSRPSVCVNEGSLEVFESVTATSDTISLTFKDPMPAGYVNTDPHTVSFCFPRDSDSLYRLQTLPTEPSKPVAGTTFDITGTIFDGESNQVTIKAETNYWVRFGDSYGNYGIWKYIRTAAESTNNAPTVANQIPNQTATVGSSFSYAFPANTFADADTGDTLTYTATKGDGTALPSWLTFTANTRTFSGTPAAANVGTLTVKVTASDSTDSVSDEFDIVVSAANSAPTVANAIPNQTATVGSSFSYAFPANTFADADTGDTLTYTATKSDDTALPTWLTFTPNTRTFSGTPAAANIGTLSVKVTASDSTDSVSDEFDIVVSAASTSTTLVSNRSGANGTGSSGFGA